MMEVPKIGLFAGAGIGAFALLLLIISAGTTLWLDDYSGNSVGLFQKCYGDNKNLIGDDTTDTPRCVGENRVTQGGLIVFGLLLLAFGVIALIASAFVETVYILFGALALFYFASMFVMAAYATWGTYAREPYLYAFPTIKIDNNDAHHTSMGSSYHLCVAAHYFLWTALTIVAFVTGHRVGAERNSAT